MVGNLRLMVTLRNDAASSATSYTISGGTNASDFVFLNGGTISSLNGGIWAFARPINGYGTISSPFTNTSTITANTSGQTLHITGSSTAAGTLTSSVSGAILSLESSLTAAGTGATIAHTGEVDLNGATLIGSSGSHWTFNNTSGAIKLTGNSTFQGNVDNGSGSGTVVNLNGHTLHLNAAIMGNTSGATAFLGVDGGILDLASGASSIGNGAPLTIAGGSIISSGGTLNSSTLISGYGTIATPITTSNAVRASGGTLYITNGINETASSLQTNGAAGDVLDLAGNINLGNGGFIQPNFAGRHGNGLIQFDGATIQSTGTINSNLFDVGNVTVVNNSTLMSGATYDTVGNWTINAGKTFNITGATLSLQYQPVTLDTPAQTATGSVTNNGTLAVGTGTFNNGTGSNSNLTGTGTVTLAGGSITGTGGFTSTNTLLGYGNVTAPYTNQQKVIADGNGTSQTLTFTATANGSLNTGGLGWFAQNTGKLILPSTAISADGAKNWGGDPATLGMVNSVGLNFHGVTAPGNLSIAVLSLDRPEIPTGLTNAIGVWQFTASGGLAVTSMDATFRYDDAVATALGADESLLTLYHYNGTAWDLVSGTTVDTTNNILAAFGLTSFSYYAIEEGSVAVPEPGTWLGASLSAAALLVIRLWRIRRRRAKIPICYSMLGEGSKRDGAIAAALLTSKRLADM